MFATIYVLTNALTHFVEDKICGTIFTEAAFGVEPLHRRALFRLTLTETRGRIDSKVWVNSAVPIGVTNALTPFIQDIVRLAFYRWALTFASSWVQFLR